MPMQRERRLLNEWLWEFHPDAIVHRNYPLGERGEGSGYKEYMVTAPRCDAWYEEGDEVFIVEAKIVDELKGISELKMYGRLFLKTPELKRFSETPINLILLRAREKPEITEACIDENITPVTWCPQWCKEYLAELIEKKRQR